MKIKLSIFVMFLSISFCFSQTDISSKYSLDVLTGFNTSVNSNSQVGPPPIFPIKLPPNFGSKPISVILHRNFSSKFSLGLGTDYNSIDLSKENSIVSEKWKTFSITVGPEYKILEKGKFSMQVFGRVGTSFISVPESNYIYPNSDIVTDSFSKSNSTAFEGKVGTSLSFQLSNALHFITNVEYAKNINNSISYQTRDISSAVKPDFIDQDLANSIPFETKKMGISSMSFNFGIRFNFMKTKHDTAKASITSTSRVTNPEGGDNGDGNPPTINANDWNSTRSNKTSKTSRVVNPEGEDNGDGNPPTINANDWNSTRSNKTSKTSRVVNPEGEGDDRHKIPKLGVIIERIPLKKYNIYVPMSDKKLNEFNKLGNEGKKIFFSDFVSKIIQRIYPKDNISNEDVMQATLNKWCKPCPLYTLKEGGIIELKKGNIKYKIFFSKGGRKDVENVVKREISINANVPNPEYINDENGGFCYRQLSGPDIPPLEPMPEVEDEFCMDASGTSTQRIGNPEGGNDENGVPLPTKGRGRAKRECLNSGGTFSEKPNGTYFCYKQLSMARVGSTTPYQAFKGGKRKCWRAGGTWMTNSHGSWCANATKSQKNKVKEVIKKKESVK